MAAGVERWMDEWMVGWKEGKMMIGWLGGRVEMDGWMVELLGGGALNGLAVPSCRRRMGLPRPPRLNETHGTGVYSCTLLKKARALMNYGLTEAKKE